MLVEHGVADGGIEPVVPEAAIAHHRDHALVGLHVEGGSRRGAEAIAHGRGADVEGRKDREKVAADIRRDVMRPQFLLDEFHCSEDRPFRAAGAEARRARRHHLRQRLHLPAVQHRRRIRQRRAVTEQARRMFLEEAEQALLHHRGGVFACHGEHILAGDPCVEIAPSERGVQGLLDEFGLPLLHHNHGGFSG